MSEFDGSRPRLADRGQRDGGAGLLHRGGRVYGSLRHVQLDGDSARCRSHDDNHIHDSATDDHHYFHDHDHHHTAPHHHHVHQHHDDNDSATDDHHDVEHHDDDQHYNHDSFQHDHDDAAPSAAGADGAFDHDDELPGGGPALDALERDRLGLRRVSEALDRCVLHHVDAARRHARPPGPGHDGERVEHVLLQHRGLQPGWHLADGDGAGEHARVPGDERM